jgi:hypothetical protein
MTHYPSLDSGNIDVINNRKPGINCNRRFPKSTFVIEKPFLNVLGPKYLNASLDSEKGRIFFL